MYWDGLGGCTGWVQLSRHINQRKESKKTKLLDFKLESKSQNGEIKLRS